MLAHISMDVCAIPATSVPCEQLFSAGAEIATDHHLCLSSDRFEHLQVLKNSWHHHIVDHAAVNSSDINEVFLDKFKEMFVTDTALAEWDTHEEITTA